MSNHNHLVTKLLFTSILFTITFCTLAQQIKPLTCLCNVCGDNNTYCATTQHRQSRCYKKVQLETIDDITQRVYEYGCISGAEGHLGSLQCYTNIGRFRQVTYMRCCNERNICNEDLPDPTGIDDERWNIPDISAAIDAQTIIYCAVGVVAFILIFAIMYISIRIVKNCILNRNKNKSVKSNDSICSLKLDNDKLFVGSSISTHSYSVSDSLPQKHDQLTKEASSTFMDLTSGIGAAMLNERTMARAIGMGKTDHVGDGRFGRVFRGEYHGEDVAVKAFRSIDQDSWQREDLIFRSLNHDNIVRFIASEITPLENNVSEIWMFLEYCPYGSLCDYLDERPILGQAQAVKILYSIINGLNYLHEDFSQGYKRAIAHRDIKSRNILMKTPDTCCIADFGHALFKIDEHKLDYGNYNHLKVGTIRYMAPEILKPDPRWNLDFCQFSTFAQADLYQFGLILWEVCYRTSIDVLNPALEHKMPYDGRVPQNPSTDDMIKIVCEEQYRPPRLEEWERYTTFRRLSGLMVECWRPNPKARMETLGVKKKIKELL